MNLHRWFFLLVTVSGSCSLAYSYEIVVPATQIEQGGASVSAFYAHTGEKLQLELKNRAEVSVSGISYFSDSSSAVGVEGKSDDVSVQVTFNPWNGFYYWTRLGAGKYELAVPSLTVTNTAGSGSNGWIAGAGVRTLLFPDTIVTPAMALEIGVTYRNYALDRFRSGEGQWEKISHQLELADVQGAFVASKRLSRFEPFGGVKILRSYMVLTDTASLAKAAGVKDSIGFFAGARFAVYPREAIVVEADFFEETKIVIGWNTGF